MHGCKHGHMNVVNPMISTRVRRSTRRLTARRRSTSIMYMLRPITYLKQLSRNLSNLQIVPMPISFHNMKISNVCRQ